MTATRTKDGTAVAESYPGTKLHAMRISDDVWSAAIARSAEAGSSVTAEVVAFLTAYGKGEAFTLPAVKRAGRRKPAAGK